MRCKTGTPGCYRVPRLYDLQVSPRGLQITTTIVLTSHPKLLTKFDRAIQMTCFFMEAMKNVTSNDLAIR